MMIKRDLNVNDTLFNKKFVKRFYFMWTIYFNDKIDKSEKLFRSSAKSFAKICVTQATVHL